MSNEPVKTKPEDQTAEEWLADYIRRDKEIEIEQWAYNPKPSI